MSTDFTHVVKIAIDSIPQVVELREHAARFFIWLIWAHVPIVVMLGLFYRTNPLAAGSVAFVLATAVHVIVVRQPGAFSTRAVIAVALTCMPILFVYSAQGPWQIDYHMYFFAVFAMLVAFCDWRPIAISAILTAFHHLILDAVDPSAVFPSEGGVGRVVLHGAVVFAECGVLLWITSQIRSLFRSAAAARALAEERSAALEESDLRLQAFLRAVPQIVWTADAAGSIDWYNNEWFEYTGQSLEEALEFGWEAAHHPEDFPKLEARWRDAAQTCEPFEMESRFRKSDGSFRWFLTRVTPQIDASGTIAGWFGSSTDIASQKFEAQRSTDIAEKLQEAFIPNLLPMSDEVRFDAVYLAAERDAVVGGDWYDVMNLPDGRILISCGDVTGHGIDAAALAGRFRHSIAVASVVTPDPATILWSMNRTAIAHNEGIATAVIAVFDPESMSLTYAIAGHPPPAVALTAQSVSLLPNGGLPLGVLDDASWVSHTLALRENSVVIFYTDGITELSHDVIAAEQLLIDAAALLVGAFETTRPALAVRDIIIGSALPVDDVVIVVLQCAPSKIGLVHV